MHDNCHRYYDPSLGRYITSDPIGLEGGINSYGYALQNPLKYYDPDGRFAFVAVIPFLGGGAATTTAGGLGFWGTGALLGRAVASIPGDSAQNGAEEKLDNCSSGDCPPCRTVTGKTVAVGAVGYGPLDIIPDDVMQHGVFGSHHNIFIGKQAPKILLCPLNPFGKNKSMFKA